MRAAILTTGDELTSGYRLDTNSQTIARRLATVPLETVLHLTVGDDLEAIQAGLRTAMAAAEVVIVSGGLGPTEDDLTRQAVATFFDRPLVEDREALEQIRERFARRGRPMPERNRVQAQLPAGSRPIPNERGTAIGFYLQEENLHLFVVPGVPYEMEGMLESFILPRLRELVGGNEAVLRGVVRLFGPTESEVAERIRPMLGRERNPLLGLLPHRGTITVEVVARGTTAGAAERLLAADIAALQEAFGQAVLCTDERDLPQVVGDLLAEHGLTLAVAETAGGTGGLVVARLTEAEGSSRWLREARVVEAGGSEERVTTLASRIRQEAGASIGLATGDLLLPPDAPPNRPYGVLTVAMDRDGRGATHRFSYSGDRIRVRELAVEATLNLLRLEILSLTGQLSDALAGT